MILRSALLATLIAAPAAARADLRYDLATAAAEAMAAAFKCDFILDRKTMNDDIASRLGAWPDPMYTSMKASGLQLYEHSFSEMNLPQIIEYCDDSQRTLMGVGWLAAAPVPAAELPSLSRIEEIARRSSGIEIWSMFCGVDINLNALVEWPLDELDYQEGLIASYSAAASRWMDSIASDYAAMSEAGLISHCRAARALIPDQILTTVKAKPATGWEAID